MPRRYDAQLRYAKYYAKIAARAEDDLYRKGEVEAGLALFDLERPQIDAGWDWARERAGEEDADALLLDYANATAYTGDLRYNKRRERIPQQEAALAAAQRLKNRAGEGAALGTLGLAYANLGDVQRAISFHEQYLEIAREIGDRRGEGYALGNLGNAYYALGDAQRAISFFEQRLEIAREIGDRQGEGNALGNLGIAYADLGDAHRAISFFEQHLAVAREIGDRRGEAITSWNLGDELAKQGDLARAIALMEVYVDFLSEIGHTDAETHAARLEQLRQRLAASQGTPPADAPDEG